MAIVKMAFWISTGMLAWTYVGYPIALWACDYFFSSQKSEEVDWNGARHFTVSVIVPAFNEEGAIEGRIADLRRQTYPQDKVEVLVCSDGSTDGTAVRARSCAWERLKVLEWKKRRGRAMVQNDAVALARGELLVFTDAQTAFEPDFLERAVRRFRNPRVGCVVGNLIYRASESGIAKEEARYWRFEKILRTHASNLGLLATGTGACMLLRRSIFRRLRETDDVDFVTPLDVIIQNYRVEYAQDAVAYDEPISSIRREFKARVRMTARNLAGTLRKWGVRNCFVHPLVTLELTSHKLLRWFTSYLLTVNLVAVSVLAEKSIGYCVVFTTEMTAVLCSLLGLLLLCQGRVVRPISEAAGFIVANAGMAVGVARALLGRVPAVYTPGEN